MSETPGESAAADRAPGLQYLTRMALLVGIVALLGSGAVGYYAYTRSRDVVLEHIFAGNLNLARIVGRELEEHASGRAALAKESQRLWKEIEVGYPGSYLCVFEPGGRLAVHTARPGMIGRDMGDMALRPAAGGAPATLREVVAARQDWTGYLSLPEGEWLVAFAYVPGLDLLCSLHVPLAALETEIRTTTLPWMASLVLIVGLLLPLSLGLLHRAYSASQRALQEQIAERWRAEEVLRREREELEERVAARTAALRESEERYRLHYNRTPAMMQLIDAQGRLIEVSEYWLEVMGYERDEVIGRYSTEFLREDSRRWVEEKALPELYEKGSIQDAELCFLKKNGEPLEVLLSAVAERDAEGNIVQARAVSVDLSARRQLEAELRQAQKMEAIGLLAGSVAHDFNNLLTVITGYSALGLGSLEPDDPLREEMEQIEEAGERAARLTRQLLAFSRRQVLQPEVLDLNQVIGEVARMLGRLLGENIEVNLALDPELGAVKADPGQMEQVLMNLAVNARDAMPRGGVLSLETSNAEVGEDQARQRGELQPGPYVRLVVRDTGTGMDAETRSHIFEPFFTTKERGQGTGLGLSTVHGIIRQSGGHIWVESAPGAGSAFEICLPRLETQEQAGEEQPLRAEVQAGGETILLVEDAQGVRELACRILRAGGYTVLEAASGAEALHFGAQHKASIHLLLSDVVLPGMSGREVAGRLADLHPETRVLYMSGYADHTIEEHGVLESGMSLVQKPFTPALLLRQVRQVLES